MEKIERSQALVDQHNKRKKDFIAAITREKPSFQDPYIVYDPYQIAPLTAMVCFWAEDVSELTVKVFGKTEEGNLSYSLSTEGSCFLIPIVGLYPAETTQVLLTDEQGRQTSLALSAPALPEGLPSFKRSGQKMENRLTFFLPLGERALPCAYDQLGDCRWYLSYPLAHSIKISHEGFLLAGAAPQLASPYSGTALWQFDLLGCITKEWRFADGCSGDFVQLANGNILAVGNQKDKGTVSDSLYELDAESGDVLGVVHGKDFVAGKGGSPAQNGSDWFQARTLTYDEKNDLLYVSSIAKNMVLVLESSSRKLKSVLGKGDMLVDIPQKEMTLHEPYGAISLGDRILLLEANRYLGSSEEALRPMELSVYDVDQEIKQVFFKELALPRSPFFNRLKKDLDGNYILLAGGCFDSSAEEGLAATGIFNQWQHPDLPYWSDVLVFNEQEEVVSQGRLSANALDVLVVDLAELMFSPTHQSSRLLGHWDALDEVDIDLPITGQDQADDHMLEKVWCDDERLYLKGTFYQGEMCLAVLSQGNQSKKYYMQTSRRPYGSDWLGSYPEGMKRHVTWGIPIRELQGKWNLQLIIDDVLYDSNYFLVLS